MINNYLSRCPNQRPLFFGLQYVASSIVRMDDVR